ncbi:MAG: hypothetical protein WA125_17075 [Desulfosporosinus sp.]
MELKVKSIDRIRSSVFLDGINISSISNLITIEHEAGNIPRVTLGLIPKVIEIESEVDVFVKIGDKRYRLIKNGDKEYKLIEAENE